MSKRFTDTEKWRRPWFRALSHAYRLFWLYICDNCDIAGIWYVDIGLASYLIGIEIDPKIAREQLNKQITELDGGSRWLINGFIEFQYGKLTLNNNLHRSIMATLKLRGMAGAYKGLASPRPGAKVKDKDKVKVKDKVKARGVVNFDALWKKYPNKDGRKDALRHFNASVKTEQDWLDIQDALENYLGHLRIEKWKSAKNGSTWFFNWRDWIDYKTPSISAPSLPTFKENIPPPEEIFDPQRDKANV